MQRARAVVFLLATLLTAAACAGRGGPARTAPRRRPPPPPLTTGSLALRVVYPPPQARAAAGAGEWWGFAADSTYRMQARDSTFVFGSAGRGDAAVTVNGLDVAVYPTGGWIAWLPLPDDSVATFEVVGAAGGDTARVTFVARVARGYEPPLTGAWIDTTALHPAGDRWVRPGEGVRLAVRAVPGGQVRARLPDGRTLNFLPESTPAELPWGERAFSTTPPPNRPPRSDRYVAWWLGPLGPDPGPAMAPLSLPEPDDSTWVWLEAILGADTARARWPLRLAQVPADVPQLVVVNDDTAGTGRSDNTLAGRPSPFGTYHWFFPNGTVAPVSGRWNSQVRLQLSRATAAWVDAADVQPLPPGLPPPSAPARSLRLLPGERSVVLRVPLPARLPFRVDEAERELTLTVYGVAADVDWIQYGGTDPFVQLIAYAQPAEDETAIRVTLSEPVWGYRTRWDGDDLLFEIRRPPRIERRRPLAGRRIALDAGHPPGGATGPTGVREPDVVLEIARKAKRLFEERGATVIMTRDRDAPVDLAARPQVAERAEAEVLISIHANALPDGINPFVNHGTSVYYFHPRSAPLARALNRALVRQFGYPDLGMGRGDLALARPTWMPAALTEGLFMMLPDQEAVLASDEGQWRYARGIVEGLAAFLRERAATRP